jgi:hypothetical protein
MAAVVNDLLVGGIVDSRDVARVAGATTRSVTRWRKGSSPRRPAEDRLLQLKTVVDTLRQVMREEPARLWIRSPSPDLGHEKPLVLIERGEWQRVHGAILALAEGLTL